MNPTEEITAKVKARIAIRDANQTIKSNRRILVSTATNGNADGPNAEEDEIARKGGSSAVLKYRAEKGAPAIFERIQRGENIYLLSQYDKDAVAALEATMNKANAKTITAREAGLLISHEDFDEMSASDQAEFTALGGTAEGDAPATTTAPATKAPSEASPATATITMGEFRALSPSLQMAHCKSGGKLID